MMKLMKPLPMFLMSLLFLACSDKPGPEVNYPKQVTITCKVSSSSTAAATVITYTGETGAMVTVPAPALPYSKTFTRTVNKNDVINLGYGTNLPQQVKLDILVNDQLFQSETFNATSGAIVYTFR